MHIQIRRQRPPCSAFSRARLGPGIVRENMSIACLSNFNDPGFHKPHILAICPFVDL